MTGVRFINILEENDVYYRAIPSEYNPEIVLVCVDRNAIRKQYITVLNFGSTVITVKTKTTRKNMNQLDLMQFIKKTCH